MGRYVIKLGEEQYLYYSSVVDCPITYVMSRKAMADYLVKAEVGHDYMADKKLREIHEERVEVRLKRADEKGTSAIDVKDLGEVEFCNRAGPREKNLTLKEMAEMYESEDSYNRWKNK